MKPSILLASFSLLVLPGAVALPPPGAGHGKTHHKVEAKLVRPPAALDADAVGRIRLSSDDHKGRHRFEVTTQKVDAQLLHELYMEDGVESGILTLAGRLEVESNTELELKIDTKKGDPLPLGASTNAELAGRRLEIRSGDRVVLRGVVPDFKTHKPFKDQDELRPPKHGPNPSATGRVRIASKPSKGRDRITIEARKLDFDNIRYRVFVETDGPGGELLPVGELVRLGKSSKGRFRRSTHKGESLPFDVGSVAALRGCRCEVRDDEGEVYLRGVVPESDD